MQLVSEIDLPLLAIEDEALAANPTPAVETARQRHPWLARSNVGGYIVHGYHAVKEILYQDKKLRPNFDGIVEFYGVDKNLPWSRFMQDMMLAENGERHARLRSSVAAAFTPRNANRYRGLMAQVISGLLDEWAPKGQFDFTDFASQFPITVFCGLMGAGGDKVPELHEAFEIQAASFSLDLSLRSKMLEGWDTLWEFADSLVVEREESGEGRGGLLDDLIAAKNEGRLDETELRHMIVMLFAGGYDTSKNVLGMTMLLMIDHPDYWSRCAEDRKFCSSVIEEVLRHSGISSVYRFVTEEFDYDGVVFPEGTQLIFETGLAGRDPEVFDSPMEFRPGRETAERHMAFGRGLHMCIGQHLARLQLEEALHLISQRLRSPQLAGEVKWRRYLGIWGIRSLPIAFDTETQVSP